MPTFDPSFLSGVFGVTTVVAAVLAGLSWGVVRTLRETAKDLRDRVKDLEDARTSDKKEAAAEREKDQAQIERMKQKQQELSAENATLAKLVTGEVHWVALTHMLEEHHNEATDMWSWLRDRLGDLETEEQGSPKP